MDWITVAILVGLGMFLLVVELFIIPGSTVVGFMGAGFAIAGIVVSYLSMGPLIGSGVLVFTLLIGGYMTYWITKSKTWSRFTLKSGITHRVNTAAQEKVKPGQMGITITPLRPSGTAEFNGEEFEVHSVAGYVAANQKVKAIEVERYKIVVQPQ